MRKHPPIDPGTTFGRLTVIRESEERGKHNKLHYLCSCVCGNEKIVCVYDLLRDRVTSCGCKHRDGSLSRKHGCSGSALYVVWKGMKARCNNPNHSAYYKYGARGITVCKEWMDSFERFIEDMGDRPSNEHSIERIDNNGNYCPENCCWATKIEQARNKRSNHIVTINGVSKPISVWLEENKISRTVYDNRIKLGWSVESSITTPNMGKSRAKSKKQKFSPDEPIKRTSKNLLITYNGKTQSCAEWSRETGINQTDISRRLQRGWSVEDALTAPIQKRFVTCYGKTLRISEWSKISGIPVTTIISRIKSGWSEDDSVSKPVDTRCIKKRGSKTN